MEIAKLKLVSELELLEPTVNFVYKIGLSYQLTKDEANELSLAVNEIITDICLFSFRDEVGFYDLIIIFNQYNLEVLIKELGEPFELDKHKYDSKQALDKGNFEGAGFEIVKSLLNQFEFNNLGKDGKEFRLIKNISCLHISNKYKSDFINDIEISDPKFDLDEFNTEDAEDISKLIYHTYGYTYPKENLYYPKKIIYDIENKNKFGVIVRTKKGEPVGYFAVLKITDSNIGEVGEAVVAPKFRGKGVMSMMMTALIKLSQKKGLLGLFGEAVTVHKISQKVNSKFNYESTAILLGIYPTLNYKKMNNSKQKRLSVVIDFLPLQNRGIQELYFPKSYKNILFDIYETLKITVRDKRVYKLELPEKTELTININYNFEKVELVVKSIGHDFSEFIQKKIKNLKRKKIKVVYIDFPLDLPATKKSVDQLIEQGFIFSGLMPLFHHEKDYLRLQKILYKFKIENIMLNSVQSNKIKEVFLKDINNGI